MDLFATHYYYQLAVVLTLITFLIPKCTTNNLTGQSKAISTHHYGVQFYAFPDPNNPKSYTEITIGDAVSLQNARLTPGARVHLLAHGFGGSVPLTKHFAIITALKRRGQPNVIAVNYESTLPLLGDIPVVMGSSYLAAQRKYAPVAGQRVADFIMFLIRSGIIINQADTHLIGHSLGGHVMGCAGYFLQQQNSVTIGRITGLDVAGPFYQNTPVPANIRLDSSDATFVDVLHTSIDGVGILDNIGHADFYANGGLAKNQYGCSSSNYPPLAAQINTIICAHDEWPIFLWGYTILPAVNMRACLCQGNTRSSSSTSSMDDKFMLFKKKTCSSSSGAGCVRFGEYSPLATRGKFYLPVTDSDYTQIQAAAASNGAV